VGKLILTVAVLLLIASHDAIADDQVAPTPPVQSQTIPLSEPGRSIALKCVGTETTTIPERGLDWRKKSLSDFSIIVDENARSVFWAGSIFALRIVSFESDHLFVQIISDTQALKIDSERRPSGVSSVKHRIRGVIYISGRVSINEFLAVDGETSRISNWDLDCKEARATVPLPLEIVPRAPQPVPPAPVQAPLPSPPSE
jgi:hypothetical protein